MVSGPPGGVLVTTKNQDACFPGQEKRVAKGESELCSRRKERVQRQKSGPEHQIHKSHRLSAGGQVRSRQKGRADIGSAV